MFYYFGKLEIAKFTFTAIDPSKDEVVKAIIIAWTKHCKFSTKSSPFGTSKRHLFKDEKSLAKAIEFLRMEMGTAYRLYKK